jgi:hypothetical protein
MCQQLVIQSLVWTFLMVVNPELCAQVVDAGSAEDDKMVESLLLKRLNQPLSLASLLTNRSI